MKEAGFSLMEMLLVLALIAVMTAVAVPVANRQSGGTELRATAHQFASLMRTARGAAIRDNAERALVVDPAGRRFWVEGLTKAYPVAGHIEVRLTAPPQGLQFFADGSATGGRVVLAAGGHTAVVELDGLTGHARVRWRR